MENVSNCQPGHKVSTRSQSLNHFIEPFRNSKLGIWPPDLPDLVNLNYATRKLPWQVRVFWNACSFTHFQWKCTKIPDFQWQVPFSFKSLIRESLCTHLNPFKTIWLNFIIVYPIDSFWDHMTWFFVLYTQIIPFKTIWPNFIIVYPINCFQDHLT